MRRLDLILRVRSHTRDFSNSIFRESDIIDYLNESIERLKQLIPEFEGVEPLLLQTQIPNLIPPSYHHLLALFASSRCFAQDERYYQATTLMNEFEVKVQELLDKIDSGLIHIKDELGVEVMVINPLEYIDLSSYYNRLPIDLESDDY